MLQRQEPYSLQRAIKRPVKRNRVVVFVIYDQWDVDLMDMTKFSKYNCGYNFILVAIDIFSKYVWLRPLKTKRCESVMNALNNVFGEDRLTEQESIKAKNLDHDYVERVIKTIKSKMYRYFTHAQSYNYIEELQKFADNYNKAFHRTR